MAKDENAPFIAFKKAVESIFHMAPSRTFPECQELQEAIQHYQPEKPHSFIKLVAALGATLPYFEKWRINFEPIRDSIDFLAKQHNMAAVDWDYYLAQPKNTPRLQINTPDQQSMNFIPWLNSLSKSNKTFFRQNLLDQLIAHRDRPGFSQKLNAHLNEHPEFLMKLIMKSKENFIKISKTRLILFLTDEQIAKAIIKYLPEFQDQQGPLNQVKRIVDKLNEILTKGRSISTLLRNSDAKKILVESKYFQVYQRGKEGRLEKQTEEVEDDFKPKN